MRIYQKIKKKTLIFLLIVLFLGGFFRFWDLKNVPPGLYPDEAMNGIDAIATLRSGQFKVFYPENNGREGLFIWLVALSFDAFGISAWSLRLVSAIIGFLTILGLFLLAKELFDEKIALLSSFFLAVSFWHINFSRISFRAIFVPFLMCFGFYFLLKGLRLRSQQSLFGNAKSPGERFCCGELLALFASQKTMPARNSTLPRKTLLASSLSPIVYFILAGVFFGLGFYTYIAFRMTVLLLGFLLLMEMWRYWKKNQDWSFKKVYLQDGWWHWDVFFAVILIIILPIGLYFYRNSNDFIGRANDVSIFNSPQPLKALSVSVLKTLAMFNFVGDSNWRHNYSGSPMLVWTVGFLFLIGLILATKQFKKPAYAFLLAWFAIMLLPAILTVEGIPHALRTIGVIPAVYLFAALGFVWLSDKVRQRTNQVLAAAFLAALLIHPAYFSFNQYFCRWANEPEVAAAFEQNLVEIGNYINNLPQETLVFVIANGSPWDIPVPYPDGLPIPTQTVMLIEQSKKSRAIYLKTDEIDQIKINPDQKAAVILLRPDENLLNQLSRRWPNNSQIRKDGVWNLLIKNKI